MMKPVKLHTEPEYYLCKIEGDKLEALEAYPFSKAEARRDLLQSESTNRLSKLRYCIRPLTDPVAKESYDNRRKADTSI